MLVRWPLALQTPEPAHSRRKKGSTSPQQASSSARRGLTLTRKMNNMYCVVYGEAHHKELVSTA
jgi:hypothetical protein